jgi:prepilin-type N-terminal cleavage/methylation domain-containing protein
MKFRTLNRAGFTLIELLILLTIVGILFSNLIPRLFKSPDFHEKNAHKATRQLINAQIDVYYIQNKEYPVEGPLTDWTDYVNDYFPQGVPKTCNKSVPWVVKSGKVELKNHKGHE